MDGNLYTITNILKKPEGTDRLKKDKEVVTTKFVKVQQMHYFYAANETK